MQSKPHLLAWITCDGAHIDPSTGKHTLLGVFTGTRAREFPFVYPFMVWFLTVSGCWAGKHSLRIMLGLTRSEMQPLIERTFESEGPFQRINLINEMCNLPFAQPADYCLSIEVNGELLLATNFPVSN